MCLHYNKGLTDAIKGGRICTERQPWRQNLGQKEKRFEQQEFFKEHTDDFGLMLLMADIYISLISF